MNTEDMKSYAYSDADEMGCRGMVTEFLQAGMSAQKTHELFRDAKTNKFKNKKQIRQYLGGALRKWKAECGLVDAKEPEMRQRPETIPHWKREVPPPSEEAKERVAEKMRQWRAAIGG